MAQAGRVRIRVKDPTGALMPTAQASLLGPDGKPVRTARADEKGEIVWRDLPFGDCRFAVEAMGFQKRPLMVTVRNGEEVQVETSLDVGFIGEIVTIKRQPWWRRIFG
jgi:uncharacterized surface anchored protein